ncbi:acyltransferase [Corynebacterium sp. zg-331]|uniref:acyltransferase family protein n=1 Tax=unclassified Corynebacterium TaxID=2624378 RepID=UPI00128D16A9|nr:MULTISPECIES: acyltransferase [unclassified Corynebacterium]MBC3186275.1 acyltransferase [Corynebacterium sp. zg-331]MPV52763.1 hypothetical protein [Corynebacterium sp. zg331]
MLPDFLPGGFIGVDIFFVLSGFLITSILLREEAVTGRISMKDFLLRIFRRIFPLAMTVLFVITAVVGLIGEDLAVRLRAQFIDVTLFINN